MGKDQSLSLPFPLALASTSKYRAQLLAQLSWPFTTEGPGVDEDKVKSQGLAPEDLALALSRMKAKAVYQRQEGRCVIGSDQVCRIGDQIFDRPATVDNAIQQLTLMQGKAHELLTAVTVISPQFESSFLNTTILHMRKLDEEAIRAYVEEDLPLDCAGSYKIESKGIRLFERIEMTDHTAIIGLPLIELSNLLIAQGWPV